MILIYELRPFFFFRVKVWFCTAYNEGPLTKRNRRLLRQRDARVFYWSQHWISIPFQGMYSTILVQIPQSVYSWCMSVVFQQPFHHSGVRNFDELSFCNLRGDLRKRFYWLISRVISTAEGDMKSLSKTRFQSFSRQCIPEPITRFTLSASSARVVSQRRCFSHQVVLFEAKPCRTLYLVDLSTLLHIL